MGAGVVVHDRRVKHWWGLESQDTYPAPGYSLARFFRNEERLSQLRAQPNLADTLLDADGVILAVRQQVYLNLLSDDVVVELK